ncbi:MAG: hypothetical protein K0R94_291 [Burkholderiales bacterium]|jgi:hypothetical protein|nr:hypothetical protein [Burkholderiales bacterium]
MNNLIKCFMLIIFCLPIFLIAQTLSPDSYLVSPSGAFNIGFVDYHWINTDACPSEFAAVVNKNSFSQNNPNHCNEVRIRVYYPTNESGASRYEPRSDFIKMVGEYYKNASVDEIDQINHLQSFSIPEAKIVKGKYPVIFFTSGYDVSPQMYENILTTLVSYGYIVVAINSEFLNGGFKLSNGNFVNSYLPKTKEGGKSLFMINWQDLSFIYKQVLRKKLSTSITNSIDFQHVGLLGHSLGAGTVVHFAEKQKVQAVVTLDLAWDNIYPNPSDRDFKAPFLEMFSSEIYLKNKSGNFPYLYKNNPLRKDKYIYILRNRLDPNQNKYTLHMSFSDQATLAYLPVISKAAQVANNNPDKRFNGLGNGWNIAAAVNEQLLLFFNQYLKVKNTTHRVSDN